MSCITSHYKLYAELGTTFFRENAVGSCSGLGFGVVATQSTICEAEERKCKGEKCAFVKKAKRGALYIGRTLRREKIADRILRSYRKIHPEFFP